MMTIKCHPKKIGILSIIYLMIYYLPTCSSLAQTNSPDQNVNKSINLDTSTDPYPGKWKKLFQKNTTQVFSKKVVGSELLAFKAIGKINAPVASVLANLRQVEGSTSWTPGLKDKVTVENISDIEAITYSINKVPWPFNNRDLLLHNKLFLDEKDLVLVVKAKSIKHESYPPKNGLVRAEMEIAAMGFRPINDTETFVRMVIFVDPKGKLPTWLINFVQKDYPIDFLAAIEKRANENPMEPNKGIKEMLAKLKNMLKTQRVPASADNLPPTPLPEKKDNSSFNDEIY